jgi:hypothetical protein
MFLSIKLGVVLQKKFFLANRVGKFLYQNSREKNVRCQISEKRLRKSFRTERHLFISFGHQPLIKALMHDKLEALRSWRIGWRYAWHHAWRLVVTFHNKS